VAWQGGGERVILGRKQREKANDYLERAYQRIGWIFDHGYPEPDDVMKPFVFALMTRAVEGEGDDAASAIATLEKLFPPRGRGNAEVSALGKRP
jgi:hypothetical protein